MGDRRLSSVQHNPQADRDSLSREATGSQLPPGLTVPFVALASGTAPLGHYCGGRRARLRGGRLGCVLADCFLQSQEPDSTSPRPKNLTIKQGIPLLHVDLHGKVSEKLHLDLGAAPLEEAAKFTRNLGVEGLLEH